ncbi:MAG: response regulator [Candidatus Omnitrophota bacterium]|nr:response regulator [Candidatus Omnitrophota bacterium]
MAKKILIVDDEPDIIKMLQIRLESANYNIVTAQDGQEALNRIKEDTPDLLVLDIMMPKINGYTLFKMLREDLKYKNIPIIILTASVEIEDLRKCIKEGVEAYLRKPYKPEILLGLIKGLLGE